MSDAERLLAALGERNLTLGSVESLTGGLFSASICSVPGASKIFMGSLVTYAAWEKTSLLGISKSLLDLKGVVSNKVASEMASRGKEKLQVDVCISFTGNAGPGVEPGGQPVGSVFIAIADSSGVKSHHLALKGTRDEIRNRSVDEALALLLKLYPSAS